MTQRYTLLIITRQLADEQLLFLARPSTSFGELVGMVLVAAKFNLSTCVICLNWEHAPVWQGFDGQVAALTPAYLPDELSLANWFQVAAHQVGMAGYQLAIVDGARDALNRGDLDGETVMAGVRAMRTDWTVLS
ncbi:MAG TPA: hypothetical protein EYP04_08700 [Anaerolineae bacterium]|nr:hypothetical protein [Anaerolineae bacterium]